ncbi:hypothetical protein C8R44DRAFT_738925 [Mycena epipterygia]|nr:hypothetical protein C8R44DRAFT_738925 [Mycena epipterygia]
MCYSIHFDVIESDSIATVPHTCSSFVIDATQRYSVVLYANSVPGNYWIRAPMIAQGSSKNCSGSVLQEYQLATFIDPGASAPADHIIDLFFDTVVELRIDGADHASQSPLRFDSLFKPSRRDCASLLAHLCIRCVAKCIKTSDVNPPRRDVIAVEFGGVIIRFRGWFPYSQAAPFRLIRAHLPADTPGPWFLHWWVATLTTNSTVQALSLMRLLLATLIGISLEAGLAVVFAESPGEIREGPKLNIITPQWLDLFPAYNALAPEFQ